MTYFRGIHCDYCSTAVSTDNPKAGQLSIRQDIRKAGWEQNRVTKKDKCPQCILKEFLKGKQS